MKFAALDIGSNAIRLQFTRVLEYEHLITFKKLQYVRFPLRLGNDVFSLGRISEANKEKFFKLMEAYKLLIDLYEVDHYYGCATSAMRESDNGKEIIERVHRELDLDINIISGDQEADMINSVIALNLDERKYLHIDVGGGSTELNFYFHQEKLASRSFQLGSVRNKDHKETRETWAEMKEWIQSKIKGYEGRVMAIGTGGNINKIYEIAYTNKNRKITLETIRKTQDYLKNMTVDELLNKLQLNPDRADVIIPASDIYIHAMQCAKAQTMLVPDVGLKDGINYYMFEKFYPSRGKIFVKNS